MQGSREVTIKTLNIRRTAGILAAVCVLAACANGMNSGEADISTMKPRLTSLYTGDTAVSLTPIFYWAEVSGATSYDRAAVLNRQSFTTTGPAAKSPTNIM